MKYILFLLILFSCSFQNKEIQKINNKSTDYQTLINLFYDWREFENPPLLNGAPDYTKERFKKKVEEGEKDKKNEELTKEIEELKKRLYDNMDN